mgnify:CR=1 FL=1|jgi:hypothetical protein
MVSDPHFTAVAAIRDIDDARCKPQHPLFDGAEDVELWCHGSEGAPAKFEVCQVDAVATPGARPIIG